MIWRENRENAYCEITPAILEWLYEHSWGILSVVVSLLHDAQEKAAVYARYQETQLAEGETEELEARYEAVTSRFSAEQRELERREDTCRKRYERSLEELSYMEKKYSLKREEWQDLLYDRKEEEHQEALLEDWKRKKQKKDAQWNEEDKRTALLSQQIRAAKKKMKEECGQESPLPKSEIVTEDFEEAIHRFTREEQEQPGQVFRRDRVSSFRYLFREEPGKVLIAFQEPLAERLISSSGVVEQVQPQICRLHIPLQDIFHQPVQRSVLGCILCPGNQILILPIQVFVCDIKQQIIFVSIIIVKRSLGNTGLPGDIRQGNVGHFRGGHQFFCGRYNFFFDILISRCGHRILSP